MRALHQDEPLRIGGIRLVGVLGEGAIAQVFVGATAEGKPVAVKTVRAAAAREPGFRARFAREVSAASRMASRYAVPVVDADTAGPTPWLATAYLPGPSLAEAVETHGRLPGRTVRALAAGIADALAALHEVGLTHGRLAPHHVAFAPDGPRIVDLGVARSPDGPTVTERGVVVGTVLPSPGFRSPEQLDGRTAEAPSDIFSLGSLLAFAATGIPPFGADDEAGTGERVLRGDPNLTELPDWLRELVVACVAKDPADRPTAAQIRTATATEEDGLGWLPSTLSAEVAQRAAAVWGLTADGTPRLGTDALPADDLPTEVDAAAAQPVVAGRPSGNRLVDDLMTGLAGAALRMSGTASTWDAFAPRRKASEDGLREMGTQHESAGAGAPSGAGAAGGSGTGGSGSAGRRRPDEASRPGGGTFQRDRLRETTSASAAREDVVVAAEDLVVSKATAVERSVPPRPNTPPRPTNVPKGWAPPRPSTPPDTGTTGTTGAATGGGVPTGAVPPRPMTAPQGKVPGQVPPRPVVDPPGEGEGSGGGKEAAREPVDDVVEAVGEVPGARSGESTAPQGKVPGQVPPRPVVKPPGGGEGSGGGKEPVDDVVEAAGMVPGARSAESTAPQAKVLGQVPPRPVVKPPGGGEGPGGGKESAQEPVTDVVEAVGMVPGARSGEPAASGPSATVIPPRPETPPTAGRSGVGGGGTSASPSADGVAAAAMSVGVPPRPVGRPTVPAQAGAGGEGGSAAGASDGTLASTAHGVAATADGFAWHGLHAVPEESDAEMTAQLRVVSRRRPMRQRRHGAAAKPAEAPTAADERSSDGPSGSGSTADRASSVGQASSPSGGLSDRTTSEPQDEAAEAPATASPAEQASSPSGGRGGEAADAAADASVAASSVAREASEPSAEGRSDGPDDGSVATDGSGVLTPAAETAPGDGDGVHTAPGKAADSSGDEARSVDAATPPATASEGDDVAVPSPRSPADDAAAPGDSETGQSAAGDTVLGSAEANSSAGSVPDSAGRAANGTTASVTQPNSGDRCGDAPGPEDSDSAEDSGEQGGEAELVADRVADDAASETAIADTADSCQVPANSTTSDGPRKPASGPAPADLTSVEQPPASPTAESADSSVPSAAESDAPTSEEAADAPQSGTSGEHVRIPGDEAVENAPAADSAEAPVASASEPTTGQRNESAVDQPGGGRDRGAGPGVETVDTTEAADSAATSGAATASTSKPTTVQGGAVGSPRPSKPQDRAGSRDSEASDTRAPSAGSVSKSAESGDSQALANRPASADRSETLSAAERTSGEPKADETAPGATSAPAADSADRAAAAAPAPDEAAPGPDAPSDAAVADSAAPPASDQPADATAPPHERPRHPGAPTADSPRATRPRRPHTPTAAERAAERAAEHAEARRAATQRAEERRAAQRLAAERRAEERREEARRAQERRAEERRAAAAGARRRPRPEQENGGTFGPGFDARAGNVEVIDAELVDPDEPLPPLVSSQELLGWFTEALPDRPQRAEQTASSRTRNGAEDGGQRRGLFGRKRRA